MTIESGKKNDEELQLDKSWEGVSPWFICWSFDTTPLQYGDLELL